MLLIGIFKLFVRTQYLFCFIVEFVAMQAMFLYLRFFASDIAGSVPTKVILEKCSRSLSIAAVVAVLHARTTIGIEYFWVAKLIMFLRYS